MMGNGLRRTRVTLCSVAMLALIAGGRAPLLAQAQSWKELSPTERYDALQNYQHHQQLPADRQEDVERRYERWRNMPPDERARVRRNYDRLQHLPPKEREQFERKYEKWRKQRAVPPQ